MAARVLLVFDDLLLGSNFLGALRAAGIEADMRGTAHAQTDGYDLVVAHLPEGLAIEAPKRLGVYAHTDQDTRRRADEAGFDLVVPRSRMAREGPALVERLLSQ